MEHKCKAQLGSASEPHYRKPDDGVTIDVSPQATSQALSVLGDDDFTPLYYRLKSWVNMTAPIVGEAEAEDVFHEALLSLWKRHSVKATSFGPFLIHRFGSRCSSVYRSRMRRQDCQGRFAQQPQELTCDSAVERLLQVERIELVRRAVERLDSKEREILHLIHWEELTFVEAAKCLNITTGMAKHRHYSTLRKLHRWLRISLGPE